MQVDAEIRAYVDFVAPKLDVFEQAIYLYLLRHCPFEGLEVITVGIRSVAPRIGLQAGSEGRSISYSTINKKVSSLIDRGLGPVDSQDSHLA